LAPHRLTIVLLLNLLLIASLMIVGLSARSLGVLATGVDRRLCDRCFAAGHLALGPTAEPRQHPRTRIRYIATPASIAPYVT
jgi:hypothetical protein